MGQSIHLRTPRAVPKHQCYLHNTKPHPRGGYHTRRGNQHAASTTSPLLNDALPLHLHPRHLLPRRRATTSDTLSRPTTSVCRRRHTYTSAAAETYPDVRINIPPLSVMKDELSVAGEKNGVMSVVEKIKEISKVLEKKATTVSVEVKKSQHKYVIGPKGNAINEILQDTGVFVEMPSSDSTSETITLRGPQEKLGLALTKVYEKANSVVSYDVSCPTWLHKYIIGRKGAGIQKLTGELQKVHV